MSRISGVRSRRSLQGPIAEPGSARTHRDRRTPLTPAEIAERLPRRRPDSAVPIAVERRFHVVADDEPRVQVRLNPVERPGDEQGWEVVVEVDGVRAQKPIIAARIKRLLRRIDTVHAEATDLGCNPLP